MMRLISLGRSMLSAMTALGLLNFVVLQWFGVRLGRAYTMVHDVPPSEFGLLLEQTLNRVLSKAYGVEVPAQPPKSYPLRRVPDGWRLLRWVWPLTGWWSPYRWIYRSTGPAQLRVLDRATKQIRQVTRKLARAIARRR